MTAIFSRCLSLTFNLPLYLIVIFAFSLLTSCQRSSESNNVTQQTVDTSLPQFLDSDLAKRLPPATYGYVYWDATKDSAKQYLDYLKTASSSSTFKYEDIIAELSKEDAAELKELFKTIENLSKEGLIPLSTKGNSIVESGVAFVEVKEDLPIPGFGIYTTLKNGIDSAEKIKKLRQVFTDSGASTKDLDSKHGQGFVLPVAGNAANQEEAQPVTLYFAAKNGMFAAATTTQLLDRGLDAEIKEDTTVQSAAERFKNFDAYKKLRSAYGSEDEFFFAMIDTQKIAERAASLIPAKEQEEMGFDIKDLPLSAVAFRSSYRDYPIADLSFVLDEAKLKDQTLLLKALKPAQDANNDQLIKGLGSAPADSVFFLSFADSVVGSLKELILREAGAELEKEKELFDVIKNVKGFQFSVLPADSNAVMPGIFLEVSTQDGAATSNLLKNALTSVSTEQGLPVTNWQEKEVEGLKTKYLQTPMGVGVYLAAESGRVLIGSSEAAIKSALLSKNKNLLSDLPNSAKNSIAATNASPLMTTFYSGERTANLIQSVQGSLSMFTGGENLVNEQQLKDIRQIGTNYSVASYKDGLLNVAGVIVPPASNDSNTAKSAG